MTKPEKILVFIAIVAVILKVLLVPGSVFLSVFSFLFLSILYFPLGFATLNNIPLSKIFNKTSYQGISTMRIIGTIGLGMALSGIVSGLLFKIQFYPAANLLLFSGIIVSLIAGIIVLVRYIQKKSEFYKSVMIKTFVIGILGVIFFMTPKKTLMKVLHRNNPELIQEVNK